jgi:hypothetical protein
VHTLHVRHILIESDNFFLTLILARSFIVVLLVLEMEGEGVDDTSEALAMRHSDVIDGRVLIGRFKE